MVRRTMKVRGVTIGGRASYVLGLQRVTATSLRATSNSCGAHATTLEATPSDSDSPYFHRPACYPAAPTATGPWVSPPAPLFLKEIPTSQRVRFASEHIFFYWRATRAILFLTIPTAPWLCRGARCPS